MFYKVLPRLILIISLFYFFSITEGLAQHEDLLFASIINSHVIYEVDTTVFKLRIKESLFGDSAKKLSLSKIEIFKKTTLGEDSQDYYLVLMTDFFDRIHIAKWLELRNTQLYLKEGNGEAVFESFYLTCIGIEDCIPNIFIVDGNWNWGCGTTISCLSDSEPDACKTFTSIILNN